MSSIVHWPILVDFVTDIFASQKFEGDDFGDGKISSQKTGRTVPGNNFLNLDFSSTCNVQIQGLADWQNGAFLVPFGP